MSDTKVMVAGLVLLTLYGVLALTLLLNIPDPPPPGHIQFLQVIFTLMTISGGAFVTWLLGTRNKSKRKRADGDQSPSA